MLNQAQLLQSFQVFALVLSCSLPPPRSQWSKVFNCNLPVADTWCDSLHSGKQCSALGLFAVQSLPICKQLKFGHPFKKQSCSLPCSFSQGWGFVPVILTDSLDLGYRRRSSCLFTTDNGKHLEWLGRFIVRYVGHSGRCCHVIAAYL